MRQQERFVCPHLPEMLLPAHFFSDRLLVGKASGEIALMWAVFADGLERYWRFAADPMVSKSPEFQEEEAWVMANDEKWPFSFVNLCEAFGLSPTSLRQVLLAWKSAHRNPSEDPCTEEVPPQHRTVR